VTQAIKPGVQLWLLDKYPEVAAQYNWVTMADQQQAVAFFADISPRHEDDENQDNMFWGIYWYNAQ